MNLLKNLPTLIMPVSLLLLAFIMLKNRKENVIDVFFEGCREGLKNCVSLIPSMLVVFSGVGLLFSSTALDVLANLFRPLFEMLGIPVDLVALITLRPFSGSSVTAVADKMFENLGPDSFASICAACFIGCTDTIFYTLAAYFSSANVKKTRYAFLASILVMIFSVFVSVKLCELLLGA